MSKRSFQRYVLLSEDTYRGALRCLEKGALARTMEHSTWFERGAEGKALQRVEPPPARAHDTPQPWVPLPSTPQVQPPRVRARPPLVPRRMPTRAARKQNGKGSVRVLRMY